MGTLVGAHLHGQPVELWLCLPVESVHVGLGSRPGAAVSKKYRAINTKEWIKTKRSCHPYLPRRFRLVKLINARGDQAGLTLEGLLQPLVYTVLTVILSRSLPELSADSTSPAASISGPAFVLM